jgi:negative regulator of flagellin synthesis FlgM
MINPLGPTRAQVQPARMTTNAPVMARQVATTHGEPASNRLAAEVRALLAEPAPIDSARVARLRAALADGSYRIDPAQIAAAMILAEHHAPDVA